MISISMEGLVSLTDSALVALANGLWQGVALVLAVWCFFRVTSFSNAATRYVVWWVVMVTVVGLPVLNGRTPGRSPRASRVVELLAPPDAAMLVASEAADASRWPSLASLASADPEKKAPSLERAVRLPSPRKATRWFPLRLAPRRWSGYVVASWLIFALVMLGRVGWSFVNLRRLKKASVPLGHRHQQRLNDWLSRAGFRRPVALKSSELVSGPMVAGFAQPVIVLPRGLAERLNEVELDQLVLHELAHLHRRDDWSNLGQKIIEALFFFHPAVRFIGKQLNMDREIACDDWAITQTGKPKRYAACLTRLVELAGRVDPPALAPGGWTTRKQIVRRIEMSLNRSRNSSPRHSRTVILVSLAILALVGLQVARTSPLVVAAPHESQKSPASVLTVAGLLPYESVDPAAPAVSWASQEVTTEHPEDQGEAESAFVEASQELQERAEQLERESYERAQEIERQVRRQQQALARQRREIERQAYQVERARAMTLPGGYHAEDSPISEDELIELMLEIAQNDSDSEVREAAFAAIGLMGSEKAMEALIALYDSLQDPRLQRAVIASIGVSAQLTDRTIAKLREIATTGGNPELREAAVGTLVNAGGERGVDALLYIYDASQETDLKKSVIHALGISGNSRAVEKLKQIAKSDPDASLRLEAVRSFAHLGSAHDFRVMPVMPVMLARPSESAPPTPPTPPTPPAPEKQ